jgi:phosphoglycerate dehydrogenase-like enzyme
MVGSRNNSKRLEGMYCKFPVLSALPTLADNQLGLIGLGNIGLQIAAMAQSLGFKRIMYHTRSPSPSGGSFEHVPLDTLYAESDAIVLTCPLNPSTRGMIDDKAFEKMKDGMILVNVARGPIVDDEALVRALESGKGE